MKITISNLSTYSVYLPAPINEVLKTRENKVWANIPDEKIEDIRKNLEKWGNLENNCHIKFEGVLDNGQKFYLPLLPQNEDAWIPERY